MYYFPKPFKRGKAPHETSFRLLQKLLLSIQFWKKKRHSVDYKYCTQLYGRV